VTPPPVIKEPEPEEEMPPAQIPLEQSPAGWQSQSSSKRSQPAVRETAASGETEEFHLQSFLEEHVIHIIYGIIILFIVLFIAWYMTS
jgi:Fe2+ transport system protein B